MRYDAEEVTSFIDQVWEELTQEQQLLLVDNFYTILEKVQTDQDREDVTVTDFVTTTKSMFRRGLLKSKPKPVEPEVPRDRLGRKMSPKAIQYRDWEAWVQDSNTPTAAVIAKRNSDPA